jgi:hypothetical protein
MSLSPHEIVSTICPELSGSPSLPVYLEMAAETIEAGFFGSLYNYALAYKACHFFIVMGDEQGGGGSGNDQAGSAVTSMSEGAESISFAVPTPTEDSGTLTSTKYGKMLLELMASRPTMNVNRGGPGFLGGFSR